MPMYCGIGGVKHKIAGLYTGIDGVKKELSEMWASESGVKKLIYFNGFMWEKWDIKRTILSYKRISETINEVMNKPNPFIIRSNPVLDTETGKLKSYNSAYVSDVILDDYINSGFKYLSSNDSDVDSLWYSISKWELQSEDTIKLILGQKIYSSPDKVTIEKGNNMLGIVRSTNESEFPKNGVLGDYWYVKI